VRGEPAAKVGWRAGARAKRRRGAEAELSHAMGLRAAATRAPAARSRNATSAGVRRSRRQVRRPGESGGREGNRRQVVLVGRGESEAAAAVEERGFPVVRAFFGKLSA
jgi:hypothetical protein